MQVRFALLIIAFGAFIFILFIGAVIVIAALLINSKNNQRRNGAGVYYQQQPGFNPTMYTNPNDMNYNGIPDSVENSSRDTDHDGIPDAIDPNPYSYDAGNSYDQGTFSSTGSDAGNFDSGAGSTDSFTSDNNNF